MLEDLKAEVVAEGTTEETNYKKFLGGRRRGSLISWEFHGDIISYIIIYHEK